MGALFNDRARTCLPSDFKIDSISRSAHGPFRFIPPVRLGDRLISTGIASNRTHDSQIIFFDDLLHELDSLEITQHVSEQN